MELTEEVLLNSIPDEVHENNWLTVNIENYGKFESSKFSTFLALLVKLFSF